MECNWCKKIDLITMIYVIKKYCFAFVSLLDENITDEIKKRC